MLDFLFSLIPLLSEFLFGPVGPAAPMQAIGPIAGSLIASAGSSLISAGANKLFNDRPEVPDLASETRGRFQNARRKLADETDENVRSVQADAAAAGANPISAMADVIESNNESLASLEAKEADAVARAKNQMKKMKFGQAQRKHQATAQGIGSIVNGISQAGAARAATMDEGEGFFGGLFGGSGGTGGGGAKPTAALGMGGKKSVGSGASHGAEGQPVNPLMLAQAVSTSGLL